MTPSEIAEKRYILSVEIGILSEELEGILTKKPSIWSDLRKSTKSDKSADREWECTSLGIREMQCRMQMKQKQVAISSLSTLLRVKEMEAKNLW
jgi:hypothetical protein